MISIKIDKPKQLKNNILITHCGYISCSYNADIVDYLRNLSSRAYDKETKIWEIPINDVVDFCNKFQNIQDIKIYGTYENLHKDIDIEIPKGYKFKTKPFKHQIDGVKFGLNRKKFLLCDSQGLGKSKEIIDLAGCLDTENKINKVLIICGVNALKYNWQEEISTHSNYDSYVLGTRYRKNGNMYEGSGKDKLEDLDNLPDSKFIITNIETLRGLAEKKTKTTYSFPIAEKIQELCNNGTISMIAFDECHKAKDITSLQGRAMKLLSTEYMVAMSGTPLMNNPLDIYFPLYWLGYESDSLYKFRYRYCVMGGYENREIVGYKNLDQLSEYVNQVMLRRLKSEVLDLPEKIHKTEYVEMNAKQDVFYKEIENDIQTHVNKLDFSDNPLSMLIRLRQATGYTGILSDTIKESAKLDRMEELVDELIQSNQKCIIFSNWTSVTEEVKERLNKYNPAYITGDIKADERMSEVNRFQEDDNCKVIIGTIGAMGTGLTLTAAQTAIFLDSPWNRALKDQAEDRIHRIGTKGTVNIITLVTKNTIDERIEDIVYKKGLLSDVVIDGKTNKVPKNILRTLLGMTE